MKKNNDLANEVEAHTYRFQQVMTLVDKILTYAGENILERRWKHTRQTIYGGLDRVDASMLNQLLTGLVNQLVFMGELPLTVASEDYDINDHFDGCSADEMQEAIAAEIRAQDSRLQRLKRLIGR